MRIHYISDHEVLEYDEVQLFLDLGHEVFANGAYLDPEGHITHKRPGLRGAMYYREWADLARKYPRTELPPELIEPFDVIIIMHAPNVLVQNWERIKHKTVVWRSIGQSLQRIERLLAPLRAEGLKVVRYSPKERNITDFMGEDAMIRFYKDEDVYKGWIGGGGLVNFSQSLKGRRDFCHFNEIMPVIEALNGKVYGPGNEDLGEFNGGQIPFEGMIDVMQHAGAILYGGTWPACYTLSYIEALMMGLPVVAISKKIAHLERYEEVDFYEVDELQAQISGAVCDNVEQMEAAARQLIEDKDFAKLISNRQREFALQHFSKAVIGKQWAEFLGAL